MSNHTKKTSVVVVDESAPLMLSISGTRGLVGRSMTPDTAWRLAAAFGNVTQEVTGEGSPLIVVGRDSRPSSEMLGAAAVAGLFAVGCRVMRLGCVMTPTTAVMIKHHGAAGGIEITASHNPIEWNGLKCLNGDGVAPPTGEAERIIERFRNNEITFAKADVMEPMLSDLSGVEVHIKRVMEALGDARIERIRHGKFKVVLDSVNGAGCVAGKQLLFELGCELVHLNGEPTGRFAHTPEPTKENLTGLAEAVKREGADAGFAQDPDADRLAVVDERGCYIGEEYTLVLAAESVLRGLESGGGDGCVIATNLSTSRMMDDCAKRHGVELVRSAVGEANVVHLMKERSAVVGGEGNGGVIWPGVTLVRDSLSGMALVLGLMAECGCELSEIIEPWPRYVFLKEKVALGDSDVGEVLEVLRGEWESVGAEVCVVDGVRADFAERGSWIHVRASNTEPVIRILVEARDEAGSRGLLEGAKRVVIGG